MRVRIELLNVQTNRIVSVRFRKVWWRKLLDWLLGG